MFISFIETVISYSFGRWSFWTFARPVYGTYET